jgi:hypothetical protein
MRNLLILLLVVVALLACAAGSILLARGWFDLRTAQSVSPAPTVVVVPALPSPTAAAPVALPTVESPGSGNTVTGFNGTFSGTLHGDNGSSAPATLELIQTGGNVTGRLNIGNGLVIDGGNCGVQAVPGGAQTAAGPVDPASPNHLESLGTISASGFSINVRLTADLAPDGQSLNARADLTLPFLCGRSPAISGTFSRN